MFSVIPWSCFLLLLHSDVAFSEDFPCDRNDVGRVELYEDEKPLPNSQGIVVVCIEVEHSSGNSSYERAAVCWGGESTFNKGAAAAACRQGSYSNVKGHGHLTFDFPKGVQYYIPRIQCPIVKDYASEGETVLLRCSHDPARNASKVTDVCPTGQLAAVECQGDNITMNSDSTYNGQMYIGSLPNLGEGIYPYIKLEGRLLPMCLDRTNNPNFTWVGQSICRQLGYTDLYKDKVDPVEEVQTEAWNLGSLECNSGSYSCFTDCFNRSNYTNVSSCTDGVIIGLGITCIYLESNQGVFGSGSKKLCEIDEPCPTCTCNTHPSQTAALAVFLTIFGVISLLAVPCMIYSLCNFCKWLKNRNYNDLGG